MMDANEDGLKTPSRKTMWIINQPWDGRGNRLGDHLLCLLNQERPRFTVFRACVAFAKLSGILRLAPALQQMLTSGGRVEFVIGVDEGITSRQALETIIEYSSTAHVFRNPGNTFHPKLYLAEIPNEKAVAFIGSSNLTAGGLFTNYEANIGVELDLHRSSDLMTYREVISIFNNAANSRDGNSQVLTVDLINALAEAGLVTDETHIRNYDDPARRQDTPPSRAHFPRVTVPPAPRIDPSLVSRIPQSSRTRVTHNQGTDEQFEPSQVFVMTLGTRDSRQAAGYSRDIFIPLAARDFDRDFWGWPAQFSQPASVHTIGAYSERRGDILVRPPHANSQIIEGMRLYYYDLRHEFRLNCGHLVVGAQPGDLLVIRKPINPIVFAGRNLQYEAEIITQTDTRFESLSKECVNTVRGSSKRWGYL